MIIPDVNLLIYAYDSESPYHAKAAAWWQKCLSESEPIGLPSVVIFAFMRITTHARVFQNPITLAKAADHVRSWLAQPCAQVLEPGANHEHHVLKLLEAIGTAANLVTDAQIAALAIEYDAVLHTADSDFLRFPGVRWFNPLTGVARKTLGKL